MDIKEKLRETYSKYDENIRNAHMKIVQIEKMYKNKTRKENDNIIDNIKKIIDEVSNDN